MSTLVSVITPTWDRHELLLGRCVPSVQAQDYPDVEHVVLSDGPDTELMTKLGWVPGPHRLIAAEMPERDPEAEYGSRPRKAALSFAAGEYVTYCDDDDALRPQHCALMAAALDADPGAGFAVSRMVCHGAHPVIVGWGPLAMGNVGSPMIMHRMSVLEAGTWGPDSWTEDWDLVQRWLDAGIRYVNVDAETSDAWPSRFR